MKTFKFLVFIILFIELSNSVHSQTQADSIHVKTTAFGTTFLRKNKLLTPIEMLDMMKDCPEAFKKMKAARRDKALTTLFGGAGGFLMGWPLGSIAYGGEFNVPMFATGAGLVVVAVPFSKSYIRSATQAVEIYNASLINRKEIEENIVEEEEFIGKTSKNIFYYSSYSKSKSEVCLFVNEGKKVCLSPGNYYVLKLPLSAEKTTVKLVSELVEEQLVLEPQKADTELHLFKFKKNQQFSLDQINGDTKREIISSLKKEKEVK
jgi:hypothetical protein